MSITVVCRLNGVPVPLELDDNALAAIAAVLPQNEAGTETQRYAYGDRAAAAYLGWPVGKVEKLSAAGKLPFSRLDGTQRKSYDKRELDAVLEKHHEGRICRQENTR